MDNFNKTSSAASQSPQTFSRIHRPWLNEKNTTVNDTQTSTATVASPARSLESTSGDDERRTFSDMESVTSDSPMDKSASTRSSPSLSIDHCSTTAAEHLANVARINERLFAGMHHSFSTTPAQQFPPQNFEDFSAFAAAASAAASAAAAVDPITAAFYGHNNTSSSAFAYGPDYLNHSMEHAYQRVLAEEAHAKQLLSARKQRPKKHKCPHCAVSFSNNGQLQGHIRSHTGERPFRCDAADCGKAFTRNEELTRHKRIHSGVRPFSCATCAKSFGRRDHLKKHMRTHMPSYQQHSYQQQQQQMEAALMMYPYLYGC